MSEGEVWDAPNQQVVRADQSHPSEEGSGGEAGEPQPAAAEAPAEAGAEATDYESMTKIDLLELAQSRGISPANNAMTKEELIEALNQG